MNYIMALKITNLKHFRFIDYPVSSGFPANHVTIVPYPTFTAPRGVR
jgi:hypothetical protein